jgi:hypothetical protein
MVGKKYRTEKDLESECNTIAFNEYGFLNLKQISEKGVPDRLYFKNGRSFFVEFKDTGKRPTKLQRHIHRQLEAAGMTVYVVDNVDDFIEICNEESEV